MGEKNVEAGSLTAEERYGELGPGRIPGVRLETNLRELGGYAVAGGGRVRRGMIFRGPRFSELAPEELAFLERAGVRAVLDLRSGPEAAAAPDVPLSAARHVRVAGMYVPGSDEEVDFSPQQMQRMGAPRPGSDSAEKGLRGPFLESYAGMAFHNPGFRTLFELLLEGGPVLFHCTSGKDRTGVAAMLVLLALGVSREDAVFDYALTNAYRAEDLRRVRAALPEDATAHEVLLASMAYGVDPSMGDAALDRILERYGTFNAYFEQDLGLTPADLARLRDLYVTKGQSLCHM